MADEEESLGSDSDDEEYVPEEEEVCSSEDEVINDDVSIERSNGKRKKPLNSQSLPARKRRGGMEDDVEDSDSASSSAGRQREEEEEAEEKKTIEEQEKKARLDELWAGFKKETSLSVKTPAAVGTTATKFATEKDLKDASDVADVSPSQTITIKKTFDFAGEDVVVEEKVMADSQEALDYKTSQILNPTKPTAGLATSVSRGKAPGVKALLQSLNKKPKISTLEKSRLDWDKYKLAEGIQDELQFHSKDGYLEKKEFLQRADLRQFEQERDERLKKFKKLY